MIIQNLFREAYDQYHTTENLESVLAEMRDPLFFAAVFILYITYRGITPDIVKQLRQDPELRLRIVNDFCALEKKICDALDSIRKILQNYADYLTVQYQVHRSTSDPSTCYYTVAKPMSTPAQVINKCRIVDCMMKRIDGDVGSIKAIILENIISDLARDAGKLEAHQRKPIPFFNMPSEGAKCVREIRKILVTLRNNFFSQVSMDPSSTRNISNVPRLSMAYDGIDINELCKHWSSGAESTLEVASDTTDQTEADPHEVASTGILSI